MINLMYLVLTALLALNVSAEIFNAFKLVDKGLTKSNAVLDAANKPIPDQVAKLAKKKPELQNMLIGQILFARYLKNLSNISSL